jgi:hypothetical protein
MQHINKYPVDYSASLLSVFDIGGSLTISNFDWSPNGIQHDMNKLTNDLKILEDDYLNACEKIVESEGSQ